MKKPMRLWSGLTAFCFVFNMVFAQAGFAAQAPLVLPTISATAPLSAAAPCALLRGLKIDPQNPLKFTFIIDPVPGKKVDKGEFRRLVGCGFLRSCHATPPPEGGSTLNSAGHRILLRSYCRTFWNRSVRQYRHERSAATSRGR